MTQKRFTYVPLCNFANSAIFYIYEKQKQRNKRQNKIKQPQTNKQNNKTKQGKQNKNKTKQKQNKTNQGSM